MASRRPKGSGSVKEVKPGVWRVRVFVGSDPITRKPRQVERTVRGGRRKAEAVAHELASEVQSGARSVAIQGTVAYLFSEWTAHLQSVGRHRPVTIQTYEQVMRVHLFPALGLIELRKLAVIDLDRYYRSKQDEGFKTGTVRHHHAILSSALEQAVKWQWVTTNVAKSASPPALVREEKKPPSGADIRKLLEAAEDDIDLATAVALAALTGARRGELCGLKWTDIDWDAGTLLIERAQVRLIGGDSTGPTKSGKPRRVSLGTAGLTVLTAYRAAISERARGLGIEAPPDGWLLSADCGTSPTPVQSLSHSFQALGKRAGVPVTPHLLRHFAASEMVGSGVDVRTAAGRLGHTPEMLLRVYAHVMPMRDAEAAKLLGLAMSPAEKGEQ